MAVSLTMLLRLAVLALLPVVAARAETPFESAMALVHAHRYPEARSALEAVVAAEPRNAAAWYQLGIVWAARHDRDASEQAVRCLGRAVELEPSNAGYLAEFGGVSLELAARTRSLTDATRGRNALEKAVALAPNNLDAREGLFQYYMRAPFFIGGSTAKAQAQLEEIRQRDPQRATALAVLTKASAHDYAGAFALCDAALAAHPDDYTALYQYGRTASISGQNLQRGLACLQKAATLPQPRPAAPSPSNIWYRIGDIEQQLGRNDDARIAYETALKLDANNTQASSALAKLKS